ncbi:MAG: hypothetical protein PHW96_03785 [Candidatus Nanoarchaeia archaeon]|nr:hypothetical protein [Candidatus Nanoarchaeia archaeon]
MKHSVLLLSLISFSMFMCACTEEQYYYESYPLSFYPTEYIYTWVGDNYNYSFCYPEVKGDEACGMSDEQLDPYGGAPPYTFSLSNPEDLAPGITLLPNGFLSGEPTTEGTYTVEICATDNEDTKICAPLEIEVDDFTGLGTNIISESTFEFTIPVSFDANVGTYFEYTFCEPQPEEGYSCGVFNTITNPTGGSEPYTFSVGFDGGLMAPGLALSLNGLLSGTPTLQGVYYVQICARDNAMNDACDFTTITVGPELEGTVVEEPVEETSLALTFDSISCSLIRHEDVACGYNQHCITDYYKITASGTISCPVGSSIYIATEQGDAYNGQYYLMSGGDDDTLMTASWDNDNRYSLSHQIRRAEGNPESTTWTFVSGENFGFEVRIESAYETITPEMTANERKIRVTARASYSPYSGNWQSLDEVKEIICE